MGLTLLLKDYPDGFPNESVEILKDMSFTDGKNVVIVGSMALRSQVYAGDYDANELVTTLSVKEIVSKFKTIIKNNYYI